MDMNKFMRVIETAVDKVAGVEGSGNKISVYRNLTPADVSKMIKRFGIKRVANYVAKMEKEASNG